MDKEILMAIDGSIYSHQALVYCSRLFAENDDVHFRLCNWITAGSSVMPSVMGSQDSLIPSDSSLSKREHTARRSLCHDREKLIRFGVSPQRIQSSVKLSGYNIATSIQQTARDELVDAILIGRRGLDGLSKMLLGSVSSTLSRHCHGTPIWIIDGEVESKNFLVAVDGSKNTLMAIDHLCHIFEGREDIHFCLFHCTALFGKKPQCQPEQFHDKWGREWCDTHLSGNSCLFNAPQRLLLEANIPMEQIEILSESSDLEEAHGIIREAKKQNCGTIVMGRRGAGMAKGLLGGVSDRAINNAQNLALWIIG